jgi:hypothetical protein
VVSSIGYRPLPRHRRAHTRFNRDIRLISVSPRCMAKSEIQVENNRRSAVSLGRGVNSGHEAVERACWLIRSSGGRSEKDVLKW